MSIVTIKTTPINAQTIDELKTLGFDHINRYQITVDLNDKWLSKRLKQKELKDVYGRFSVAKYYAMEYCKRLENKLCGCCGHIESYNTSFFTYDFYFEHGGEWYLAHITKTHKCVTPVYIVGAEIALNGVIPHTQNGNKIEVIK